MKNNCCARARNGNETYRINFAPDIVFAVEFSIRQFGVKLFLHNAAAPPCIEAILLPCHSGASFFHNFLSDVFYFGKQGVYIYRFKQVAGDTAVNRSLCKSEVVVAAQNNKVTFKAFGTGLFN